MHVNEQQWNHAPEDDLASIARRSAMHARTRRGEEFEVPQTLDVVETLLAPWRWGIAELLTVLLMLSAGMMAMLRSSIPVVVYIVIFAFWRLSYNAGVGLLLHLQSERGMLTQYVSDASPSLRALHAWVATRSLPRSFDWARGPVELNAWLLFRAGALIVLTADGMFYLALFAKCMHDAPQASRVMQASCVGAGALLVAFSIWAKLAAHRSLGDYAWHWGDFFFFARTQLELGGVFGLAPHPMYTLGYTAYYGLSLAARSHLLLLVSLCAHAAQIAFLFLVEEPHMERIYGTDANGADNGVPEDEIKPAVPCATLASRVDACLVSPFVAPCAVACTMIMLTLLARPPVWALTMLLAMWRLLHFIGLGWILVRQKERKSWTQHYARAGRDAKAAFEAWVSLYSVFYAVNHALFVCLSLMIRSPSDSSYVRILSRTAVGVALFTLALCSGRSAYDVLGIRGFAYGDFFLPLNDDERKPRYDGVFRYLDHPSAATEYLAYFAMALWRRSWTLGILAAMIQVAHYIFLHMVEIPHMKDLYFDLRDHSEPAFLVESTIRTVSDAVPFVRPLATRASELSQRAAATASDAVYTRGAAALASVSYGMEDSVSRANMRKRSVYAAGSRAIAAVHHCTMENIDSKKVINALGSIGVRVDVVENGQSHNGGLKVE